MEFRKHKKKVVKLADIGNIMRILGSFNEKGEGEQGLIEPLLEVPHPLATREGKFAMFVFMLGLMLLWGAM